LKEPQFYFKKDEPKAIAALDLLMLTQGYRYFDYIEYVQNEKRLKYLPDQYNILSGKILNTANQPVQAKMFLINTVPDGKAIKIQTDAEGMFFFSELEPQKNYYLFAQSFNKKEKINIQVLQNGVGYNPTQAKDFKQLASKPLDFGTLAPFVPALVKNENKKQDETNVALPMPNKNLALNEVVVTGYGTQRKRDVTGAVQIIQAKELNNFNDWSMALQGKVAGVQVRGNANPGGDLKIAIRGMATLNNNSPLFVVNGIPMEQINLNTINTNDVESVTVLKDASATALYGARAANGVIIIDLKKFRYERMGIRFTNKYYYTSQQVFTPGVAYSVARKFYVPKYTSTATSNRSDFRETIYWNPVVQTDTDGKAVVEFYNSDASTTFRAITEGIGYNGKLGRAEATYAVQKCIAGRCKNSSLFNSR